jgi:hypothetical protein
LPGADDWACDGAKLLASGFLCVLLAYILCWLVDEFNK